MLTSIGKLQEEYKQGLSVSEKLKQVYEFIDKNDQEGDKINAFITLTKNIASKTAQNPFDKSKPLSGVMVGVKDNIHIKGVKTTCASGILSNYEAIYEATVVKKLKEAGAIIIGKCNMDEFAMGATGTTSRFGTAKNPYDIKRVAGGSSSGSAAAVAKGFVNMSLGSDTGGSVRVPAAYCNLVGLKPTYGAISRYGVMSMAAGLDQVGALTHTVKDCAILFNVLKGYDENDPNSIDTPNINLENIQSSKTTRKIGVIKQLLPANVEGADPEIAQNFEDAVQILKNNGHEIIEIDFPEIEYVLQAYFILSRVQSFSALSMIDGIRFGDRKNASTLDEVYKESRTHGFHPEIIKRILTGNYILSSTDYYNKARQLQTILFNKLQDFYKNVDALLSVSFFQMPPKIDSDSFSSVASIMVDKVTALANITSVPALTVPSGFSKDGLPMGVHFTANLKQEQVLFELAFQIEKNKGVK